MLERLGVLALVIIILSVVGQQFADRHSESNEVFRKLFHVIHGVALAGLAFAVPLNWIIALEILFFISVLIARYVVDKYGKVISWAGYLGRAYRVGRLSFGEFFFPLSVIGVVLLAQTKWEFAASVLVLGLADAMAAIVGKKYGASTTYAILGQKKSLAGSAAFFVVALAITSWYALFAPHIHGLLPGLAIVAISLVLTLTENIGVYGSDNFLIPLVAVLLLNSL